MYFSPYQKSRAINYGIGSASEKDANVAMLRGEYARTMHMSLDYVPDALINGEVRRIIARKTNGTQRYAIQSAPGETFYAGDIVECYGSNWIIIEVEANKDIYSTGTMLRCNHKFRFQNGTNEIFERWGVLDTGVYSTTVKDIDYMTVLNKQYKIYLPLDDDTRQIYIGKRFGTSTMKDSNYRDVMVVYRTTEFDDASENYGQDTLLVMKCVSDQYDPARDNMELMICDYVPPEPEDIVPEDSAADADILYSGEPVVRIGGSGKTFRVEYIVNERAVDGFTTEWSLSDDTPDGFTLSVIGDGSSCRVTASEDVVDGALGTLIVTGTIGNKTAVEKLVIEAVMA